MHTHTNKERKSRGDLSVVTLQIVLKKKEKEEKKKKEKETKTCGAFLDSACSCCKNTLLFRKSKFLPRLDFLNFFEISALRLS